MLYSLATSQHFLDRPGLGKCPNFSHHPNIEDIIDIYIYIIDIIPKMGHLPNPEELITGGDDFQRTMAPMAPVGRRFSTGDQLHCSHQGDGR